MLLSYNRNWGLTEYFSANLYKLPIVTISLSIWTRPFFGWNLLYFFKVEILSLKQLHFLSPFVCQQSIPKIQLFRISKHYQLLEECFISNTHSWTSMKPTTHGILPCSQILRPVGLLGSIYSWVSIVPPRFQCKSITRFWPSPDYLILLHVMFLYRVVSHNRATSFIINDKKHFVNAYYV